MDYQNQSVLHVVTAVADVLQALHPQLVFSAATLEAGQVRMHFAGYDEDSHAFRPFAGLAAARRLWSKVPEPTVIFGFESDEFLRCSMDAVILEQEGVAWLLYTATYDEIQQAIDKVLSASPVNNDQRIDQLSEEDFNRDLQNFGHVFKPNIINTLIIRRKDLISADPETRESQYLFFSNVNPDYLRTQKEEFEHILTNYREMPFTVQYQAALEKVRQLLDDADCDWTAMMALAQAPFSDEAVGVVDMKLADIVAILERMYDMTRKIRSQLNQREQV